MRHLKELPKDIVYYDSVQLMKLVTYRHNAFNQLEVKLDINRVGKFLHSYFLWFIGNKTGHMPHVQNLGVYIIEGKQEAMLWAFLIPETPINENFSMNAAECRKRHFPEAPRQPCDMVILGFRQSMSILTLSVILKFAIVSVCPKGLRCLIVDKKSLQGVKHHTHT